MKVIIAFAKRLRRPKLKRKRFFKNKNIEAPPPAFSQTKQLSTFATGRTSMDKSEFRVGRIPLDDSHVPHQPPPAYNECVQRQQLGIPAVLSEHCRLDGDSKSLSTIVKESPRGRSPQILYRSQLNSFVTRKTVRRPSPSTKRASQKSHIGSVNDLVALRVNHFALSWWRHVVVLRVAMVIVIIIAFLFMVLGY